VSPARAAWITGSIVIGLTALFVSSWTVGSPGDLVLSTAFLGLPVALAAAVLVFRLASVPAGRDIAERLLSLATRGRDEWERAMRAELASIDDPSERRRFAIGCLVTTVRVEARGRWPIVIGTGVVLAIGTLVTSRVLLGGQRSGIMIFTLFSPAVALFVVSLVTAWRARSFRAGLVVGALASLATMLGVFAVALLEAGQWHEAAGVYIMDGDAPKVAIDTTGAMLDAVSPNFLLFHLWMWAPWPVLGAAAGALGSTTVENPRPAASAGV
jgi:hypothetical protein